MAGTTKRKVKWPENDTVVVATSRRDFRESEADPDFDKDIISEMSSQLRLRMEGNSPFSIDESPVEKYAPPQESKCRQFWRKLCCRCCSSREKNPEEHHEEEVEDEESLSTVQSTVASVYPYEPQPTLESMNIRKIHKRPPEKITSRGVDI